VDYESIIEQLSKEGNGMITTKAADEAGLSRAMLCKLCKSGVLYRISKGQYGKQGEIADELFSLSQRTEHLVFSHETALFLHNLSHRTSFIHSATTPANKVPSQALRQLCKIYYIKPEWFALGKTIILTQFGNQVPCYDMDRTICDVIRSRNKMNTETFLSALRQYADDPKKNLNRLNAYAKEMGLTALVHQYMAVLL